MRSVLVVGATAVIRQLRRRQCAVASPWLVALLKRKPPKLAAVALANKIARIAWKLMATGETYRASAPAAACTTSRSAEHESPSSALVLSWCRTLQGSEQTV